MNRIVWSAVAAAVVLVLAVPTTARAEQKLTGTITKLDVAKDKKSAVAVLRDNETAGFVTITIVDDVTLQKFERSIIAVGDEIKCKYEKKGTKNVARSFKKAAGCS
ncbi:MAG TPA: hypothetical protein VFL83_08265 [Anaeromyxobacter sp.]|nr:hypothetical protein [Anaeromyxobacter sp.]